jgi:Family of unknown function (DUF5681)
MQRIGKGNPPAHSRFKPGTSGNPSGRPKGRRGFKTELIMELAEPTEIGGSERPTTVTKQRAIVIALLREAIGGDLRAIDIVIRACAPTPSGEDQGVEAPEDQAIVDALTEPSRKQESK